MISLCCFVASRLVSVSICLLSIFFYWTSLFTTNGSRNKRRKKYRQQTNKQWCDLTNLTEVCNSMTMTSKEKHLANTDIVIPQHAFVTFKFLTDFVFLRSIERCRFQWSWGPLTEISKSWWYYSKSSNSKMVQWQTSNTRIQSIDRRHFQWPWSNSNPYFKARQYPTMNVLLTVQDRHILSFKPIMDNYSTTLHTPYSSV